MSEYLPRLNIYESAKEALSQWRMDSLRSETGPLPDQPSSDIRSVTIIVRKYGVATRVKWRCDMYQRWHREETQNR